MRKTDPESVQTEHQARHPFSLSTHEPHATDAGRGLLRDQGTLIQPPLPEGLFSHSSASFLSILPLHLPASSRPSVAPLCPSVFLLPTAYTPGLPGAHESRELSHAHRRVKSAWQLRT